jgi:hypothetical protein
VLTGCRQASRRLRHDYRPALAPPRRAARLPSAVVEAGRAAGLVPVERCVALLARIRGDQLIPRSRRGRRRVWQSSPDGPVALLHRALSELEPEQEDRLAWISACSASGRKLMEFLPRQLRDPGRLGLSAKTLHTSGAELVLTSGR